MKKLFLCVLLLFAIIVTAVACGNDEVGKTSEELKSENLKTLLQVSKDFANLEFKNEKYKNGQNASKTNPFVDLNTDEQAFLKESDIHNNRVYTGSVDIFKDVSVSTYYAIKNAQDFNLGKVYDARPVDGPSGTFFESDDYRPVAIIEKDSGIILIIFDESTLNKTYSISMYYINVIGGVSNVKATMINVVESETGTGLMTIDHIQFRYNTEIETLSATFELESFDFAVENVASKINANSKLTKELKDKCVNVTYEYAVYTDGEYISKSFESGNIKNAPWSEIIETVYKQLSKRVSIYDKEIPVLFDESNVILVDFLVGVTPDTSTSDDTTTPIDPDVTTPDTSTSDDTTTPEDPDVTTPDSTDPETPDNTDPETPVDPEVPDSTDPETPVDPDVTTPDSTDPETPDNTDPETPVDPDVTTPDTSTSDDTTTPEDPETPDSSDV